MAELKTYNITFKGYRLEDNVSGIPEYSGIYMAYKCIYSPDTDKVSLSELVYIGQAENLRTRLMNHKNQNDLHVGCRGNETICYAYASVSLNDLDIVENALIFAQKPRLNENLKDNYNYESASFEIEGTCALLDHTNFKIS